MRLKSSRSGVIKFDLLCKPSIEKLNSIPQIIKSRTFLLGMGCIFLIQLILLLFTTPLYDIDTNSFIRGGLSWDIYHNPFENIFIAVVSKFSKNATFIVSFQIAFFAFSGSLLAHVLFENKRWILIAILVASLEPITMFYNFSFLPESFYTSFTILYCSGLILWMKKPKPIRALFFGGMLGIAFICKLSAMAQIALLALMLIQKGLSFGKRLKHILFAVIPFAACYLFVLLGQKTINEGGLYTVAGRVRWDFSSSQYHPDEIEGAEFKKFVDPYILKNGSIINHRELRRELSYLGYKDCVSEYELKGTDENHSIACCDSIFGAVGSQIMSKHFLAAEWQFIKDNFWCIHHLNYLDYRFTPELHYYHPEKEYTYIDSLMAQHYGVNLSISHKKIPVIWRNLGFTNIYLPFLWWVMVICIFISLWGFWKISFQNKISMVVLASTIAIPVFFHLVYISYRPRFLAPYYLIGIFLLLEILYRRLRNKKPAN